MRLSVLAIIRRRFGCTRVWHGSTKPGGANRRLPKMEPSLIYLETPEQVQLAYAEAASAVDFINQSKGREGVRELLAALNDKPTPEAIEKVYGMSFDSFETKW